LKELEVSAKTVDEATRVALEQLGVTRDEDTAEGTLISHTGLPVSADNANISPA